MTDVMDLHSATQAGSLVRTSRLWLVPARSGLSPSGSAKCYDDVTSSLVAASRRPPFNWSCSRPDCDCLALRTCVLLIYRTKQIRIFLDQRMGFHACGRGLAGDEPHICLVSQTRYIGPARGICRG